MTERMQITTFEKFNLLDGSLECRHNQVLFCFLQMSSAYLDHEICTLDWVRLYKSAQTSVKILNDVREECTGLTWNGDSPQKKEEDPYSDQALYDQCCKFQSPEFCQEVSEILERLNSQANLDIL